MKQLRKDLIWARRVHKEMYRKTKDKYYKGFIDGITSVIKYCDMRNEVKGLLDEKSGREN